MQDFILVHRKQNGNPLVLNVPTWTTCLRQIAFLKNWELDDAKTQVSENDEVFEGYHALQFLIQVVCGLQSTLIGETEVHGQFKKFIMEHQELKNLGEAVLLAAKKVRTEHLMDLGSQSYGSFIRKKVTHDSVSIVGAGMLTQEILPWLKKVSHVDLHVRNLEKAQALKAQFPFVQIKSLEEKVSSSVLVIAAPIENSLAINLISSNVSAVFDLRGGGQSLNIQNQKLNYESLPVIMEQIQKTQVVLRAKLMASEVAINRVAEDILKKLWLRPGGWEDLCG